MSLLVSQYTEHVAMRVEGAVTASGTFVHSFLASFISLSTLSNLQNTPFTRGQASSSNVLHTKHVRETDSIRKL